MACPAASRARGVIPAGPLASRPGLVSEGVRAPRPPSRAVVRAAAATGRVAYKDGRSARRAYLLVVKLRDVVDLEVQLAFDEEMDDGALRTRDRGLYLALAPAPTQPDALLGAWLEALRARFGAPRLGERVEAAQRLLSYLLAIIGLTVGWGVAEALLYYEQGGAPVNIGHYLLVLVLGQIAMLALLSLSSLLGRFITRLPLVGDLGRLLRFFTTRLARLLDEASAGESLAAQRAAYQRARTRHGLYGELERYAVLSQSQLFALAFNIGALSCCVRLVLLSDLAFAWSTSVASLNAVEVQRVCSVLASPFAWLVPEAMPSASLIEHTQYFRLEGRFADAPVGSRGDPALAGEWWRFLLACTLTYGLLPRVLTFSWFRHKLRRAHNHVPLDTPAVQRVLARMTTPVLSTRAHDDVAQQAEPARHVERKTHEAGGPYALILFRDVPTTASLLTREIELALGLTVTGVDRAGGFDVQADAALCERLGRDSVGVCLVAEAWEAPDKSLRALLSMLRQALGPRRSVHVVLIGEASESGFAAPAGDDVRLFRDRLTLLQDPYLSVETLAAASESDQTKQEVRA